MIIIAYLDILAFSHLLQSSPETAYDIMNRFNEVIPRKLIDQRIVSKTTEQVDHSGYFLSGSVTSFENVIKFSDSLIIGSTKIDLFITQLSNLIASLYMGSIEPFIFTEDIGNATTSKYVTVNDDYSIRQHKAFPLLIRGGVSIGEDASFYPQYHIKDSIFSYTSLDISGKTYLNAVTSESKGKGKGPRLFCDKNTAAKIAPPKIVRKANDIDEDMYEIVWTVLACERSAKYFCSSDKWHNVTTQIEEEMLPATINLFQYFKTNRSTNRSVCSHYKSLLNLVCAGIVKYAENECNKKDAAIELINTKLREKKGLEPYLINDSITSNFLG